jgi:hypothetical protein
VTARLLAAFLAVAVGLIVVACDPVDNGIAPTDTPTSPSGIRGTVLICPGPPAPEDTGQPCASPYPAELAILDDDGNVVTRVTAAADGSFSVDLPAGDYTIAPKNGDPYPTAPSQPVTVTNGQYVQVQINFDSGAR